MVSAIIPAAGYGRRMGAEVNKQYLELGGLPIVGRTLQTFSALPEIDEIILVVRADEMELAFTQIVQAFGAGKTKVIPGGATRQESVARGVKAVDPECQLVVVHDGARPLVDPNLIRETIAVARVHGAAIAAVPVKDTIKVVRDSVVVDTPSRATLWSVQTPQAFQHDLLKRAHQHGPTRGATDDASLVEGLGYPVTVVMGSYRNLKITTPEDLILAEILLKGADS